MHRSGTSAVAGVLVRLGLTPPLTPLAASDDNPAGFYEPAPVVQANFLMMKEYGCAWNWCLWLNPHEFAERFALPEFQALQGILQSEFGDCPAFVMKDPRLCLTLPAWVPALRARQAVPSALIVCRHPAEVARSLAARNGHSEDDTAAHWLHHMLEAELASRGMARSVMSYDDLMADWRTCVTRLGRDMRIDWPVPVSMAETGVERFLAPSLRHHSASGQPVTVGVPLVRALIDAAWPAFLQLRDDPGSAVALACLDHVRHRFAKWRRDTYPPGTVATWPEGF
jgi:hypothetical protein